ncbi:M14 family zinc carboxypeptidase [Microbacterium sp. NIBRBAC000506063]|uniref:M14 family zinc carboxypeptidase n=1 Tax=Microbacterium sp. NIBRBAC000506063 TaxID=2734618 RepID=UPI001BB4D083|nr:M14 family zinc carboxypeptidase [Microbacterium sp. NIBRBAC000506063]QTV80298.1 hypothetical protein KAE78_04735 [Microbacterium sp. NIBRBAC000506063]
MHNPVTAHSAIGPVEEILRRAGGVSAHTAFPTVDELHAAMEDLRARRPDLVTSERIGTSRLGEPIRRYRVGSGALSALIVGGVHPNEPIGSLTVLHLVEQLIADDDFRGRLDTTWHIVPCADPDGMRLNEGWFATPPIGSATRASSSVRLRTSRSSGRSPSPTRTPTSTG